MREESIGADRIGASRIGSERAFSRSAASTSRCWSGLLGVALLCGASNCTGTPDRARAAVGQPGSGPASAASSSELPPGSAVPALPFTLQDGFQLDLPALKGKLIAVYFCAAYDEPDCVLEAKGLRERYSALHESNHVVVLGVSPQDAATHKRFIAEHKLPFDLAADGDRRLARAFGVPTDERTLRLFLVGKDGKIRKVWHTADPETQIREILAIAGE